jgi:hypothetical protein
MILLVIISQYLSEPMFPNFLVVLLSLGLLRRQFLSIDLRLVLLRLKVLLLVVGILMPKLLVK